LGIRAWGIALAVLGSLPCASVVRAEPPSGVAAEADMPRVALYVEGTDARRVQRELHDALAGRFIVVPLAAKDVLPHGWRDTIGPALSSTLTRGPVLASLADAAVPAQARAVVVGIADRIAGHGRLVVYVLVPSRGSDVDRFEVAFAHGDTALARAAEYEKDLDPKLEGLAAALRPQPPAALPTAASPPVAPTSEASPAPPLQSGPPPASTFGRLSRTAGAQRAGERSAFLDFGFNATLGNRWFSQTEPSESVPRNYHAGAIVGAGLSVEVRPIDLTPRLWWTFLVEYWQSLGLTSWSDREGKAVGTLASRLGATARVHVKLGASPRAPEAVVEAGYGRWTYDVDVRARADLERPAGDYQSLRAGLQLRQPLPPFVFFVGGGVAPVFETGSLGNRYAGTQPWSADASGGVSFYISRTFEVRAFAAYRALGFELLPLPGFGEKPAQVSDAYLTYGASLHVLFW
jgi:hypothetical protein